MSHTAKMEQGEASLFHLFIILLVHLLAICQLDRGYYQYIPGQQEAGILLRNTIFKNRIEKDFQFNDQYHAYNKAPVKL